MDEQAKSQPADLVVPICSQPAAIESIPFVKLPYQWFNQNPVPDTWFRLVFVAGEGFLLHMRSDEPEPLARYQQMDDPVYTDSCMEFFADFFPQLQRGYLNFEMNPNGAMLCQIGTGRSGRVPVRRLGVDPPRPVATRDQRGWQVSLTVPLMFIRQIYGRDDFTAGSRIHVNFYKCGDDLPRPHFGSWHHLGEHPTNFHQPENFGVIMLQPG